MAIAKGGALEGTGSTKQTKTGPWRTYKPKVDHQKCVKCLTCTWFCPEGSITLDKEKKQIKIDYDYCKGCGICAKVCPVKAIIMELDEK